MNLPFGIMMLIWESPSSQLFSPDFSQTRRAEGPCTKIYPKFREKFQSPRVGLQKNWEIFSIRRTCGPPKEISENKKFQNFKVFRYVSAAPQCKNLRAYIREESNLKEMSWDVGAPLFLTNIVLRPWLFFSPLFLGSENGMQRI